MITSLSNERVRLVRALQSQRKARERERALVVEGVRLAEEVIRARLPVRLVFHGAALSPHLRALLNQMARLGAEIEEVTPAVMKACSDDSTPPGLLAVLPSFSLPIPEPLEWALVADRIANPGNLGSLLRCAEAFGIQVAFLPPGTADPFNPKVLRGAMGAHFRLPMPCVTWAELKDHLQGLRVLLAEAHSGARCDQIDWRGRVALILGGEASGPGDQVRSMAVQSVRIPVSGGAESLNVAVASGILLFEAARLRGRLAG
ncbi:MAG: RNA methyltransferase [Anaerolineales bacterium]|jgi:TrmH family RNA methyltransferase